MEERKNQHRQAPLRVSAAGVAGLSPSSREGILALEGMYFHAFHGCFERERREGTTFRVDLWVRTDMRKALESDALEDTVDVQALYRIVSEQMAIPRNLIETVAGKILAEVRAVPGVLEAEVCVRKCQPPLEGISACGNAGATESLPSCEASMVRLKG